MPEQFNAKEAAAAIRKALRATYPGTTFRVRMGRGTACAWVGVQWTDGPTELDVVKLVSVFESSRYRVPDHAAASPWRIPEDETRWTCEGVTTSRTISPEAREKVQREHVRQTSEGAFYGLIEGPQGRRTIEAPSPWTTAEEMAERVARSLPFES